MISRETIEKIWKCQREIDVGEKLLKDMEKISKNLKDDPHAERLKDVFGREQNLHLGIPSGNNSYRLLDVSPTLSVSIIKAHIANKEAELVEANEIARTELIKSKIEKKIKDYTE